MKVCLHNRVSPKYLHLADEIRIEYRDRQATPNYINDYPDKTLILEYPFGLIDEDIELLKRFKNLSKNLIICIGFYPDRLKLQKLNLPYFLGQPTNSFYDAKTLIASGAKYIRPSSPIFFQVNELKKLKAPVRLTVNRSSISLIPNGELATRGTFIRPEDLHYYEDLPNAVIEFDDVDHRAEEALYRIYFEQKEWPGEIDLIIKDIGVNTLNRMIPPSFGERRLNCGQRCLSGGTCRICDNIHKATAHILNLYNKNI